MQIGSVISEHSSLSLPGTCLLKFSLILKMPFSQEPKLNSSTHVASRYLPVTIVSIYFVLTCLMLNQHLRVTLVMIPGHILFDVVILGGYYSCCRLALSEPRCWPKQQG